MPLFYSFTTVWQGIADFVADPFSLLWSDDTSSMPSIAVDTREQTNYPCIYRPSHFFNAKTCNHHSSLSYLQTFLAFVSVFANSSNSINALFKKLLNQNGAVEKVAKTYSYKKDASKSLVSCSTTSSPKLILCSVSCLSKSLFGTNTQFYYSTWTKT